MIRKHQALLWILLLGAVSRFLYFQEVFQDHYYPVQDAEYHHYWAKGIADDDWGLPPGYNDPMIQETPYFRAPGYAFFVSVLYRIAGTDFRWPVALQMVLGLFNVVLLYALCLRLFNRRTAIMAAFMQAVHWGFIFFEGALLDPVLHTTVLLLFHLAAVDGLRNKRIIYAFAAGILLGIASLIRANTLLFLPVSVICAAFVFRQAAMPWKRMVLRGILYVAGCALVVLPVTFRNVRVSGEPVLISSNAGLMFYMGNSAEAEGTTRTDALNRLQEGKYRTPFDYAVFVKNLGRANHREFTHSEASRFLLHLAGRDMLRNPMRFAALMLKKSWLLFGNAEISHNTEIHYQRVHSRLLKGLPFPFAVIFAAALTGICLLGRAKRLFNPDNVGVIWVFWFLPTYAASIVLFAVSTQYRMAVIPYMFVFSAAGIDEIISRIRSGQWRGVISWGSLFCVASVAAWYVPSDVRPRPDRWYYQEAFRALRCGDQDAAEAHLRALLELNAGHAWAHGELASLLAEKGRLRTAERHLRLALELSPEYDLARVRLGYLLCRRGEMDNGLELLKAVRYRNPYNVQALNALAWLGLNMPDAPDQLREQAHSLAREAVQLSNQRNPSAMDTLAASYASREEYRKAVYYQERAVRLSNAHDESDRIQRLELYKSLVKQMY